MGLGADSGGHLVGEDHVFLLHDLGSELTKDFVFGLEGSTALGSGSIHTENDLLVLVCVGERVEYAVSLFITVGVLEEVTTVSPPEGLRLLVVEKSATESVTPLFPAEPLERVGFLTVTHELHRGPFGMKVVHGVIPGLTRVGVGFPAVLSGCAGPVGDGESLEESTGLSVEADITHALEESGGVEVLSVQVMHDIWLLVEFVMVCVLNTETYIILN
jgi:hypothetical protein